MLSSEQFCLLPHWLSSLLICTIFFYWLPSHSYSLLSFSKFTVWHVSWSNFCTSINHWIFLRHLCLTSHSKSSNWLSVKWQQVLEKWWHAAKHSRSIPDSLSGWKISHQLGSLNWTKSDPRCYINGATNHNVWFSCCIIMDSQSLLLVNWHSCIFLQRLGVFLLAEKLITSPTHTSFIF